MCPACLSALALTVAGTGSAGGLTALIVRKLRSKKHNAASRREPRTPNRPERTPDR